MALSYRRRRCLFSLTGGTLDGGLGEWEGGGGDGGAGGSGLAVVAVVVMKVVVVVRPIAWHGLPAQDTCSVYTQGEGGCFRERVCGRGCVCMQVCAWCRSQ